MRIFVGTVEIAGMVQDFARAFRSLGHHVTTAVWERNPLYPDAAYDRYLRDVAFPWITRLQSSDAALAQSIGRGAETVTRAAMLSNLILNHDTFVFIWGGESLRWNTEFPYLRSLGKRIVSIFCGSDIRHASAYSQEYASLIRMGACSELRDLRPSERTKPVELSLQNLRPAELHAHVLLSQPNQSGLAVRPYHHLFLPIDLARYRPSIPGREVPHVIHAPSHMGMKGSDRILPALERLKREGVAFELKLLQGVSNAEVLREMEAADVLVDQLHFPLHGKAGVEAMASGCALATCNRQEYEPIPANRPIWHIDPGNVYERLRALLTDRTLRVQLAEKGAEHVRRYHDQAWVATRVLGHFDDVRARRFDHSPSFFMREYHLEPGSQIPIHLQRMTERVVRRWGMPDGIDPREVAARGLMTWTSSRER